MFKRYCTIMWLIFWLIFHALVAEADDTQSSASGRMSIFITQETRAKEILEEDFSLIGNFMLSAQEGDEIQGISTTNSKDIFSYQVPGNKMNPIRRKQAQNQALAELKAFYLKLFNEPRKEDTTNDLAGALSIAMERFNATAKLYQRMSLIVLSDGLQEDQVISWRGAYPNAAWIGHELSPFSAVPTNRTKTKIDAIIVSEHDNYTNTHHKRKIQQWYSWLFDYRDVELIGFNSDHQSAANIIERPGTTAPRRISELPDLSGDLELIEAGSLAPADDDVLQDEQ